MYEVLPKTVNIVEVGPRDGFQNIARFIPTEDKLAVIDSLYHAGVRQMEITSFVSPKSIPQLADAAAVSRAVVERYSDLNASALTPNLKGAQLAWDSGLREIAYVISVSPAHNSANINRTHEESLNELARIRESLPDLKVRVDLATAYACPFSGWVEPKQVLELAGRVVQLGIRSLVLADTIGVATPARVFALTRLMKEEFPDCSLSLHLHDTRGMGLANTMAGIQAGITAFETSVGGLGGCPFAPGAAGNTATEDVVNMFNDMNVETGIALEKLLSAVKTAADKTQVNLATSHMNTAKIYNW
jgi:hydroxymethylglutaryl-CoA lyase